MEAISGSGMQYRHVQEGLTSFRNIGDAGSRDVLLRVEVPITERDARELLLLSFLPTRSQQCLPGADSVEFAAGLLVQIQLS